MKRINKQETIIRVWEYQILYLKKKSDLVETSYTCQLKTRGKHLLYYKI